MKKESKDLIGNNFGEWEIIQEVEDSRPGRYFECMCSCGKIQNVHWVSMKLGRSKRCWDCGRSKTSKVDEMIDKRFGDWIVLEVKGKMHKSYSYLCRCKCGVEKILHGPHLRQGKTRQCTTCSNRKKAKDNELHGKSRTSTYKTWSAMHHRCKNPKATLYHRYGGRGISVCKRWKDFRNFLKDMGERPGNMELDRTDNNGNYEPDNCRWVTHLENMRNRG